MCENCLISTCSLIETSRYARNHRIVDEKNINLLTSFPSTIICDCLEMGKKILYINKVKLEFCQEAALGVI